MNHTQHSVAAMRQNLELKEQGGSQTPPPSEVAVLIDGLGRTFEEFKKANDKRLAEIEKKGSTDVLLEEKLKKIEVDLDKLQAAKDDAERKHRDQIDELEKKLNRQRLAGNGGEDAESKRIADFNLDIKSLAALRGRPMPADIEAEGYRSYDANFKSYLRYGDAAFGEAERKAMSVGSDPDGGYLVTADMSGRIVKRVFDLSPIRQIANVQTISTDSLEGMYDRDENDAGWVGETETRSETDAAQVSKWAIPVHEMFAQPKATQKLLQDAGVNVAIWLADKTSNKFARMEGSAFVVGNGVKKPMGFCSYTTAASDDSSRTFGQLEHVLSGGAGDFASSNPADKLFDLIGAFHPFYLNNANFVTRRTVITKIRKFKDGQGQYLWQPGMQAGQPAQLMGFGLTMAEDMPVLASGSLSLALGDFNEGYQIVDRLGIQTLRDPYTAKPFVLFYSIKRTGGAVVNFDAIKFLKFAAS